MDSTEHKGNGVTRIALVTGGAKRIGRAICLELAARGYGLALHYRTSRQEAEQTRADCLSAGAAFAEMVCGDLSDPLFRGGLIKQVTLQVGHIDLLVNSASLFEYDDVGNFAPERFAAHLQSNYLAPVELTLALHRQALEAAAQAHVVTLLDQKIFNLNTDYMSYTLAKLASHASIRYLAQCCAPALRVNAIAPGVTLVSGDMSPADFDKAHEIAALGRSSTPEDIAASVLFLDTSCAITGQTLTVDGGQHLVPRGRDVAFGK
ncbi:MAG: SDR family oxidoreductase [Polaromonas sp.]|nr:SDR family oxidoreductase [Polaromonas sp.]